MPNTAAESFVPLSPATFVRREPSFHSPILSAPAAAPDSASFEALVASSPDSARSPEVCKPSVTLQRNGDTVTAIRIQCSCGRVTELNCVY